MLTQLIRIKDLKIWKNKSFLLIIKLLICIAFGYSLYQNVFSKENIHEIIPLVHSKLNANNLIYLFLAILLVPLNWSVEALKWQKLVKEFQLISFKDSLSSIFSGITLSIFTPNRIGEYGGRLLKIQPQHRAKGILANAIGSYAQLIILISFGAIGLLQFINETYQPSNYIYWSLLLIAFIGCTIGVTCYFQLATLFKYTQKIQWIKQFIPALNQLSTIPKSTLYSVFALSIIRFSIYCSQYVFIYLFLDISPSITELYSKIFCIFILQTSIPLPPFMDLPVRTGISVFVWQGYTYSALAIITASFALWAINIIIPSIIGMILILLYNRNKNPDL